MKICIILILFTLVFSNDLISREIVGTLRKVAKWKVVPYEENPLRFKSRESFEEELKHCILHFFLQIAFKLENPSDTQKTIHEFDSNPIVWDIEQVDLLANSSNCTSGPLPIVKRCSGVKTAGSILRTLEFLTCALTGNIVSYNPWGKYK